MQAYATAEMAPPAELRLLPAAGAIPCLLRRLLRGARGARCGRRGAQDPHRASKQVRRLCAIHPMIGPDAGRALSQLETGRTEADYGESSITVDEAVVREAGGVAAATPAQVVSSGYRARRVHRMRARGMALGAGDARGLDRSVDAVAAGDG